ncbi:MAG: tetratricopeptide repeat protein [Hyphomonadaceae bacterium]
MTSRLAAIVAVDVDNFSALAEADAAGAVAAVARLVERCAASADAHGGRVFDTTGDSVLMEFPNSAAAVHAATALAPNTDPPIRIGIHLGEVSQLPSGDLLGSGVAIAARLQEHARAGGVIVSEPVREAMRGSFARRLKSKGSIKNDKTDETIRIYELIGEPSEDDRQRGLRRLAIAGAAALGALVLLALIAWPLLSADAPARAAVLPLVAPNEDALQGLASGIAEDVTLALDAQRLNPIPRASAPIGARESQLQSARQAGAPFALEGAIERVGSGLRVSMHLTRTADAATLWSQNFEGPIADGRAIRHRAAIAGADVLSCSLRAQSEQRVTLDDATLSLLLGVCAQSRDEARLFDNREALGQVAARAPNLALASAMLAVAHAKARNSASEAMREPLRDEARQAAERALRRIESVGEAYLALDMAERRRGWDAREGILRRGLEHDDRNAGLNARYSVFLFDVGRTDDGLAQARNASTLDPLSLEKRYAVADALIHTGDFDAARDIVDRQMRELPNDPELWALRFRLAFWNAAAGDASALLDAADSQVRSGRARQCWRYAIGAVRTPANSPARAAALPRVLECARSGDLPAAHAIMLLAHLGALDEAFALARTHFVDEQRSGEDALFAAVSRPMRTDPRFMPLMKDLGLLGYWRLSGRWPDFCREPSLPYRCQAEAQRLL